MRTNRSALPFSSALMALSIAAVISCMSAGVAVAVDPPTATSANCQTVQVSCHDVIHEHGKWCRLKHKVKSFLSCSRGCVTKAAPPVQTTCPAPAQTTPVQTTCPAPAQTTPVQATCPQTPVQVACDSRPTVAERSLSDFETARCQNTQATTALNAARVAVANACAEVQQAIIAERDAVGCIVSSQDQIKQAHCVAIEARRCQEAALCEQARCEAEKIKWARAEAQSA